jgi:hypothetical protein
VGSSFFPFPHFLLIFIFHSFKHTMATKKQTPSNVVKMDTLFKQYVYKGEPNGPQMGKQLHLDTQVIASEWVRPARYCSL